MKRQDSSSSIEKRLDIPAEVSAISPEARRYVWYKMDLVVLPVVTVIYFLSFLVSPFRMLSILS